MAVKQRVSRRGSAIVGLIQIRDNQQVKSIGGYILNFVLGFAMSGSIIMTDLAPFGIGIVGFDLDSSFVKAESGQTRVERKIFPVGIQEYSLSVRNNIDR